MKFKEILALVLLVGGVALSVEVESWLYKLLLIAATGMMSAYALVNFKTVKPGLLLLFLALQWGLAFFLISQTATPSTDHTPPSSPSSPAPTKATCVVQTQATCKHRICYTPDTPVLGQKLKPLKNTFPVLKEVGFLFFTIITNEKGNIKDLVLKDEFSEAASSALTTAIVKELQLKVEKISGDCENQTLELEMVLPI